VEDNVPKPMLRIGERPILWHIMAGYARFGITDFVLCLGHHSWLIKEYFLNYQAIVSDMTVRLGQDSSVTLHDRVTEGDDWAVTLVETGETTQTAGRLWNAREYLAGEDRFLLTYGDGVSDVDIAATLDFHDQHGLVATVTGVRPPGRFGVMTLAPGDGHDQVTSFEEKPHAEQGWINGGFFVFDQRIWDFVDDDQAVMLEHEPLERMAGEGQLAMYRHEGFWQCMDTYRDWRTLNDHWEEGNTPWLG
jgi:glucose-1-phosphate cytidylyltransferase